MLIEKQLYKKNYFNENIIPFKKLLEKNWPKKCKE